MRTGAKVSNCWLFEVSLLPPNSKIKLTPFVSRDYLVYLRDFAMSQGVAATTLINKTDADLSMLLDPPDHVSESTFRVMGSNLFDAMDNEYEGVLEFGKGMHLSLHGPLGMAIQGANCLQEVAKLARKYFQIRANFRALDVIDDTDFSYIRLLEQTTQYNQYFSLSTLVSFAFVLKELLNRYTLKGQCIIHQTADEPENFPWYLVEDYQIKFSQDYNQLLVPEAWMSLPINPLDPDLARIAKEQCEQSMADLSPLDLCEQIKDHFIRSQHKNIGLKAMANNLHISPSTLQRRLRELGTTFQAIKLEVRLNKAQKLLLDENITIEKIAEHLDFSDASSFTKSFKNYTGLTPSVYRSNHSL